MPITLPLIAQIEILPCIKMCDVSAPRRSMVAATLGFSSRGMSLSAPRSMPVVKLSPVPVRMTTRIFLSCCASINASFSASNISGVNEFALLGRFKRIWQTRPSFSVMMSLSSTCIHLHCLYVRSSGFCILRETEDHHERKGRKRRNPDDPRRGQILGNRDENHVHETHGDGRGHLHGRGHSRFNLFHDIQHHGGRPHATTRGNTNGREHVSIHAQDIRTARVHWCRCEIHR